MDSNPWRNSKLTSLFGLSSIETSAGMPFRRRTSDFTWKQWKKKLVMWIGEEGHIKSSWLFLNSPENLNYINTYIKIQKYKYIQSTRQRKTLSVEDIYKKKQIFFQTTEKTKKKYFAFFCKCCYDRSQIINVYVFLKLGQIISVPIVNKSI